MKPFSAFKRTKTAALFAAEASDVNLISASPIAPPLRPSKTTTASVSVVLPTFSSTILRLKPVEALPFKSSPPRIAILPAVAASNAAVLAGTVAVVLSAPRTTNVPLLLLKQQEVNMFRRGCLQLNPVMFVKSH